MLKAFPKLSCSIGKAFYFLEKTLLGVKVRGKTLCSVIENYILFYNMYLHTVLQRFIPSQNNCFCKVCLG